jgi:hypothetical protein
VFGLACFFLSHVNAPALCVPSFVSLLLLLLLLRVAAPLLLAARSAHNATQPPFSYSNPH